MSTETWWILGACGVAMLLAVAVEIVWRLYADRRDERLADDGTDEAGRLASTVRDK